MPQMRISEMRGLACLLVVLFHAIGSEPAVNVGIWASVTRTLGYVRMPLFIGLTGFLYGRSRDTRPMSAATLNRRARRLLPPFLLAVTVCCLIDWIRDGHSDFAEALVYPPWHTWYIEALLVILAITTIIDRTVRPWPHMLWYLAIGAAILSASGLFQDVRAFAIGGALRLLPHFLFGAALGARRDLHLPVIGRVAIYGAGILALIAVQLSAKGATGPWQQSSLPGIAIGWAAFVALSTYMVSSRPLAKLGEASFPVFLWHLPCSALLSAALLNPMAVNPYTGVWLRVIAGLLAPLLMLWMVERFAPGLTLVIGDRQRRRTKPVANELPDMPLASAKSSA